MKVPAAVVNARREKLAQQITSEGFLPIEELCGRMGISVATARRDLAHLQSRGRISRVRGGALPKNRPDPAAGRGREARQERLRVADSALVEIFESPAATQLKVSICEMGRRAWQRGFLEGASGHLSARFGEHVLCSPAGVARGFMREEMICMVDGIGAHAASRGHWIRSPEVLVDLAIYKVVPSAAAVVHAHPVYATAFAVSDTELPRGLLAEFEVFAGPIARADYRMPGSQELASLVGDLARGHQSILLRNHGLVCWGTSIEDACFKLEMTEALCRTAAIASQLPGRQSPIPPGDLEALLEKRIRLGIPGSQLPD